jgi:hypothetical protein
MITMARCKGENYNIVSALIESVSEDNMGFEIGRFAFYKDEYNEYKCEITDIKDGKLQLVGIGLVDKDKCYIKR